MTELEERIKVYYQSKSLAPEQIQAIKQACEPKSYPRLWTHNLLKYAAVFLLSLTALYGLYSLIYVPRTLPYKFAREVAFNHNKHQAVAVQSQDISVLRQALGRLNFKLQLPTSITNTFKLKGAKYCSIDNRIAAQLKLEDQNGQEVTCYIFKKEENITFESEISCQNVTVTLWDDGKRIFALAVDN